MDAFTRQYIDTALWSSTDNSTPSGGFPLDKNYTIHDISEETLKKMIADCVEFQKDYSETLADAGSDGQNGHDFWLTRNGHGTGFWDRDYDQQVVDVLRKGCIHVGEYNLYIGDDGMIHGG